MKHTVLILIGVSTAMSCASQYTGSGSTDTYHEDLSVVRPRFKENSDSLRNITKTKAVPVVSPVLTVNRQVDAVLDSIDRLNVLRKFVQGYTIQIYSGQNKDEANNTKKKLQDELDLKADLQYLQPKFNVKVGKYFTSLDAEKDLVLLKRHFPNAILVPESIPIR